MDVTYALAFAVFAALALSCARAAPVKNDICICDNDTDIDQEKIWEFLKQIDTKQEDYPIAPGLLSPQIPCNNCIEYNRRKRKIAEAEQQKEIEDLKKNEKNYSDEDIPEDVDYGFPAGVHDKTCPEGSLRQGKWCVEIPSSLL